MSLQITGRIKHILDEQSGQGRNGTWRKREFVLETEGEYPKEVCCVQWGDAIDKDPINVGDEVTAHIDIQSREYNGRWYTDVKAWRIENTGGGAPKSRPAKAAKPAAAPTTAPSFDDDDDLPF